MGKTLLTAVATLPVLVLLDLLWLGWIAKPFYQRQIGGLMKEAAYGPAFLVYALLALGLVFFVLPHAKNYPQALLWGAGFGLIVYGIYDFTNLAILKNWNWMVSLADVAWGATVCALGASAALLVDKLLK